MSSGHAERAVDPAVFRCGGLDQAPDLAFVRDKTSAAVASLPVTG